MPVKITKFSRSSHCHIFVNDDILLQIPVYQCQCCAYLILNCILHMEMHMTKHYILPHFSIMIPLRGRPGVRLGAQRPVCLLGVFLNLLPVDE